MSKKLCDIPKLVRITKLVRFHLKAKNNIDENASAEEISIQSMEISFVSRTLQSKVRV